MAAARGLMKMANNNRVTGHSCLVAHYTVKCRELLLLHVTGADCELECFDPLNFSRKMKRFVKSNCFSASIDVITVLRWLLRVKLMRLKQTVHVGVMNICSL